MRTAFFRSKKVLLAACLVSTALAAHAGWQEDADLMTAGAAASVTAYRICGGPDAVEHAMEMAGYKLAQHAATVAYADPSTTEDAIRTYLSDGANQKVKAMMQANAERTCSDIANLRKLATGMGFATP